MSSLLHNNLAYYNHFCDKRALIIADLGIVNLRKIPPLAPISPGENPLIYQGLRCALHMSNQPHLA